MSLSLVRQCAEQPCDRPLRYADLCATHYRAQRRHMMDAAQAAEANRDRREKRAAANPLPAEDEADVLPECVKCPGMPLPPPGWGEYANCKGMDIRVFYPAEVTAGTQNAQALAACASCAVRRECLQDALSRDEEGLWAGLVTAERVTLRHKALAGFARTVNICIVCDEPYLAVGVDRRANCGIHDDTKVQMDHVIQSGMPTMPYAA